MEDLKSIHFIIWIILGAGLLAQASWIFWDASKRGEAKWLWGLFGLLNIPGNLIMYLIVTRLILKPNPCPGCGKNVRGSYKYCPHCGKLIKS